MEIGWIKADPTFNGLKQVLYEPSHRVRISTSKPEQKSDYQVIDKVEIFDDGFNTQPIYFSDKLTCIIGGKSTGKSLLLNNMARTIDFSQVATKTELTQFSGKIIDSMKIYWADGSTVSTEKPDSAHKIIYIPQTYLNRLSDQDEEFSEIDEIIKGVLMANSVVELADQEKVTQLQENKYLLDKDIFYLLQTYSKWCELKNDIAEVGSIEGVEKEIRKLKNQQNELQEKSSISEEDLDDYENAKENVRVISSELTKAEKILAFLTDANRVVYPVSLPTDIFDDVKNVIQNIQDEILTIADHVWNIRKHGLIDYLTNKISDLSAKKESNQRIIDIIEPKLADNAEIKEISAVIDKEEKKLLVLKNHVNQLNKLWDSYNFLLQALVEKMNTFHSIHQEFINKLNSLSLSEDDLDFSVLSQFRCNAFREKLLALFDGRQMKSHRGIIDLEKDITPDMITSELYMWLIKTAVEGTVKLSKGNNVENALRELLSDWYITSYQVKMDNDSIEEMSPGKKALVLLKMLINLAESECPILIDQPEDDLDNRSIFKELIPFIRKKKLNRQIIIVTHNANVVLGADADEVIIANQDSKNSRNKNYRFEYRSGSIENDCPIAGDENTILGSKGIQEHICEILEGGKNAFDLRMHKYRL